MNNNFGYDFSAQLSQQQQQQQQQTQQQEQLRQTNLNPESIVTFFNFMQLRLSQQQENPIIVPNFQSQNRPTPYDAEVPVDVDDTISCSGSEKNSSSVITDYSVSACKDSEDGEQQQCGRSNRESFAESALNLSLSHHHQQQQQHQSNTETAKRTGSKGRKTSKLYQCKECDFKTSIKENLWNHLRTEIKAEKLLECQFCCFVTEHKHHYEYHLRNHCGLKPYKCPECKYVCVNKSMLNSHLKLHSNTYPYQCNDCQYVTKYPHSLKLHLFKYKHESMVPSKASRKLSTRNEKPNSNQSDCPKEQTVEHDGTETTNTNTQIPSSDNAEIDARVQFSTASITENVEPQVKISEPFLAPQSSLLPSELLLPSDQSKSVLVQTQFMNDLVSKSLDQKNPISNYQYFVQNTRSEVDMDSGRFDSDASISSTPLNLTEHQFQCPFCQTGFLTENSFDLHLKTHLTHSNQLFIDYFNHFLNQVYRR